MQRTTERSIRQEIVRLGRLCHDRGLLVALDGNLSARLSDSLVVCTRAGCHKGLLEEDDLVVIDLAGKLVRGQGAPTSEMAMHLACYRERADVRAVIHAHPPISVAFTIAGHSLARCVLPEVVLTLGVIPTVPYETTGTRELADRVGHAVRSHDAVVLDRHGAVCVGATLLEAFCRLETMEHMARIMLAAQQLGGIRDLPCDESVRLRRMGLDRYGGPPEAVAQSAGPGADLPPACFTCPGCERSEATSSPVRLDAAIDSAVADGIRRVLG